jgi:alpha-tubulin suppressor-like RCC1 family protein
MQFRTVGVLFLGLVGLMMPAATHAQTIDGGQDFTIALAPDGTVWTWGDNYYGQLGQGDTVDRLTPTPVPGLSNIVAVDAGTYHALALRGDGTVWSWGAASANGDGTGNQRNAPVPVSIPNTVTVTAISAGLGHSLALDNGGNVWGWGRNGSGQLGDGSTAPRFTPMTSVAFSSATAIYAGEGISLVVKADGTVWGSGSNLSGQLGDGTKVSPRYTPVQMIGVSGAVQVAAGQLHSLVRLNNGHVWGVGDNSYGQLCSNTGSRLIAAPTPLTGATISVGRNHSLARNASGELWVCGQNHSGQLGDGTQTNRFIPTFVPLADVADISAGAYHTAVWTTYSLAPTVWTWGRNTHGQLGDGTTTLSKVPLMVWP